MGEVYLAEDTRLGRKVAIKLLLSDLTHNEDRLHRFEQEACAASGLNHEEQRIAAISLPQHIVGAGR